MMPPNIGQSIIVIVLTAGLLMIVKTPKGVAVAAT